MNSDSIPSIWGTLNFYSSLSLENLGSVISDAMFSGLSFGGREKNIYDEVPAIFIDSQPLGLKVVLSGNDQDGYRLEVQSYFRVKGVTNERVYIDGYLFEFFKAYLELSSEDIGITSTARYGNRKYPEF